MSDVLDRYYTPADVADRLVSCVDEETNCCIDTACGRGSLLLAAERHFGEVDCVGLDRDAQAVRFLKRTRPAWVVSTADLLVSESVARTAAALSALRGLLVLNPPFSFSGRKSVDVQYYGQPLKCSVAMAHILTALELFGGSSGCVAIVPESLVHSQIDFHARSALDQFYSLDVVGDLRSCTFRGARANALMIKLQAGPRLGSAPRHRRRLEPIYAKLIRGGLPVYAAKRDRHGFAFVHSTDIARSATRSHRVTPISRGLVSGSVILLPRVGVPRAESIQPTYLRERTQLSDCVIALRFRGKADAEVASQRLAQRIDELANLYRGTGARYVAVETLVNALRGIAGVHLECGELRESGAP